MLTSAQHVVRSPHCPNNKRTCGSWGFQTSEGVGSGIEVDPATLVPLEGISGYRSDCGPVALFRDKDGRIGAFRDGRFFPGIQDNFAFERFKQNLGAIVQIQSAAA
jgi:hypothetical protein